MNNDLLMKISWSTVYSPNTFWIRVISTKYGVDFHNIPIELSIKYGSYLQKARGGVWKDVLSGIRWSAGNGRTTRFWLDIWLDDSHNLANYSTLSIPHEMVNRSVAEFMDSKGTWLQHLFAHFLFNHVSLKIVTTMPPRINGDADQMYWVLSRSDTFTVKSAYMFVAPSVPSENTHIWNIIWRWKSTQRVCTFMWLIVHNRLKTHWELYRRHIVDVRNELLEMWRMLCMLYVISYL